MRNRIARATYIAGALASARLKITRESKEIQVNSGYKQIHYRDSEADFEETA